MANTHLIDIFLSLVKIDSPSGQEDAVCKFILEYVTRLGYVPTTDSYGNIILHVSGVGEPQFLAAHVDTVEPGRGVMPIVDGDTIKSDGTTILGADNKVGVAILLDILCDVANRKDRPALDVVFTRSEEVGNYGAVNLDYSYITAKKGYTFDNPNPIGTIISASPFYNRFDITLLGKSAHASKPEQGLHVLPILAECMGQLSLGRVSQTALVNIGAVEGGHVRNTIMGELTVHGEVRSLYEDELNEHTQNVKEVFERVSKKNGAAVVVDIVTENGGYLYPEDDPELQHISSMMKKLAITPVIKQDWGVADSNVFAEHGIKAINLGDGTILTHTTHEHVKISDMEKLKELVMTLITER